MFSGLLIDSLQSDRLRFTASNQSTVEVPVLSWSRCMFESSYEINTSDKLLVQLLRPFGMLRPALSPNRNQHHIEFAPTFKRCVAPLQPSR
jgi:hypothetical protein